MDKTKRRMEIKTANHKIKVIKLYIEKIINLIQYFFSMNKILYILDNIITDELKNEIKNKECDVLVLDLHLKKYLEEVNIKTIDENKILNLDDYEEIDEKTLKFSRNWFEQNQLENIMEYNHVNIGLMFQNEIFQNLLKYLHRVKLIQKTVDIINPDIIFTIFSNEILGEIPYNVCVSKKFKTEKIKNIPTIKTKNKFDSANFPVKIFNKNFDISISKRKFLYLKKIVEKYWNIKYKFIKNQNKENKTILFLDFNLILHKSFLKKIKENNYNLCFLNNRRPIIWNNESLKIAKKLEIAKIDLPKLEKIEYQESRQISKKILEVLEKTDLAEFFKFNEFNLWGIFKKELENIVKKRSENIIILIKKIEKLMENTKIDFVWSQDDWGDDKIIVKTIQQQKIPICLILAGTLSIIRPEGRLWNLPGTIGERHADKLCIWGDNDKRNCLDANMNLNKIAIGGAPRYDELFLKESIDEDYILILTGGFPSTQNSYFFSTTFILNFEKMLKNTLKEVKKFNKKIIIKRHPTQGPQEIIDLPKMFSDIIPEATVLKDANTIDLISRASMIITVYSTVIEESIILQKPIVFLPYFKEDNGVPYSSSEAVIQINKSEEIYQKIHDCLYDDITKEKLRLGREKFLKDVFSFQRNASERHMNIMEEMMSKEK